MSRKFLILTLCLSVATLLPLMGATAQQIIAALDANTHFSTSHSTGFITTVDRFGTRTSTFEAWAKGEHTSLIAFTSGLERGQKILRTESSLYLYYPDADQVIRLQGAALRQSVLGSDLSYEDLTKEGNTLSSYQATLLGEERFDDVLCWVVKLEAKSKSSAYPTQTLWIDQEHTVVRKARYATSSGRGLKEMEVIETMEVNGRVVAKKSRVVDLLKKNSHTTMHIESLEIDLALSDAIFGLENLSW